MRAHAEIQPPFCVESRHDSFWSSQKAMQSNRNRGKCRQHVYETLRTSNQTSVTVRAGEIFGREPVAVTSLPRCGVPRRGPRPFPGSFRVGACQLCRVHHGPGNARVRRRLVNPNVAPQFPNGASWWGPTHRLRLASFKRQSHSCWTRFCYHRPLTLRRIPPLNSFHSQWFTSDASCFAHKAVTHLTPQGFHHNG